MSDFFRFPHTPHLTWLGPGQPRDDKVLDAADAEAFLASPVVIEEKIDGANLGFSTTEDGVLLTQNRGGYLSPDTAHSQFRALWPWLAARRLALTDALWPNLMLFGEWCTTVHSVRYDALPDWFLGFDVYDRKTQQFWSSERRDELLESIGLCSVPSVGTGTYTLAEVEQLLGISQLGHEPMEGIVARLQQSGRTVMRAKVVRASFTQAIETHWSRGPLERNRLATERVDPVLASP